MPAYPHTQIFLHTLAMTLAYTQVETKKCIGIHIPVYTHIHEHVHIHAHTTHIYIQAACPKCFCQLGPNNDTDGTCLQRSAE